MSSSSSSSDSPLLSLVLTAAVAFTGGYLISQAVSLGSRPSSRPRPGPSSRKGLSVSAVRAELQQLREKEKRRLDITLQRSSADSVTLQDLIELYEDLAVAIQGLKASEVTEEERIQLLAETSRGIGNAYRLLSGYTKAQAFAYLEAAASQLEEALQESERVFHSHSRGSRDDAHIKMLQNKAELLTEIGKMCMESAQFPKARALFTSAMTIHKTLDAQEKHNNLRSFVELSLARVALAEGKRDEAERYFEQSYEGYMKDFPLDPHGLVPLLESIEMHLASQQEAKAEAVRGRLQKKHGGNQETLNFLERQYPTAVQFVRKSK